MELIAVVMKCPTSAKRLEDARTLLDYGFANYSLAQVYPEVPLAPIPVLLGEQAQVQPQLERECRILVKKGQEGQVTTSLTLAQDLEAPVEIMTPQGVYRLTTGGIFSRLLQKMLLAG